MYKLPRAAPCHLLKAALAIAAATTVVSTSPADAHRSGFFFGFNVGPSYGYAPPPLYQPPPVYYAPPPVYYVPPRIYYPPQTYYVPQPYYVPPQTYYPYSRW
jgi:hypothetical protein